MKKIKLSKGKYALVDDEDFGFLNQWKWTYSDGYSYRHEYIKSKKVKRIRMHNVVLKPAKGRFVDHINGNALDNRKENLRMATHQQNCTNRKKRSGDFTSSFKGVSLKKAKNTWTARFVYQNKERYIGDFKKELHAAMARDLWIKYFHGEFARLNFPNALHG